MEVFELNACELHDCFNAIGVNYFFQTLFLPCDCTLAYCACAWSVSPSRWNTVLAGCFRMDAASQGQPRFRRTRSVSLSGDVEYMRFSGAAHQVLQTGRKSSDYCGTRERWAASRLSLHHEFSRTLSSNCIDRYSDVAAGSADGRRVLRFSVSSESDGLLHFNCLPDDCREHILSFLTISERGVAAQVCRALVILPDLSEM